MGWCYQALAHSDGLAVLLNRCLREDPMKFDETLLSSQLRTPFDWLSRDKRQKVDAFIHDPLWLPKS